MANSQHQANGRKRITFFEEAPGTGAYALGAFYDEEGRLRLSANITKADYGNLFSARRDRLVYEEDEVTGDRVIVDLAEIPLIEAGQFDNVQSDPKLQHFVRDDLLEPD